VIPSGVPTTRALKDVADDLRELQDQPSPQEAKKDGATPGKGAATLPFRPGQWLRRKLDGALVEYVHPSVHLGHCWVVRPFSAIYPVDDFEPALPREGEWWQKRPCPWVHPLPKDTAWSASPIKWCYTVGDYTSPRCGTSKPQWDALFACGRDACECGCLVPVNFGQGRQEQPVTRPEKFRGSQCMKCELEVHPDSPEALTPEFACTVKEGMCLRVNCHCLACGKAPGVWCSRCGREVRPGSRPGLVGYVCGICDPHPSSER
jgi:hypothetical protein